MFFLISYGKWNDVYALNARKGKEVHSVPPSPRIRTYVEVTVVNDTNDDVSLEYKMPETLFDASAPCNSILQFRIPITDSTSIESAAEGAIEEARVVLGSRFHITDELTRQIRDETEKCVTNYFKCNACPVS